MFRDASEFNQPVGNWDTSKVTDMNRMFWNALNFNQPFGNWDTSKVTNMSHMFENSVFNQSVGSWNTSQVTSMNCMFASNAVFNQPVGNWDTSSVNNMESMFEDAFAFNQDLSSWNTGSVKKCKKNVLRCHLIQQRYGKSRPQFLETAVSHRTDVDCYTAEFDRRISGRSDLIKSSGNRNTGSMQIRISPARQKILRLILNKFYNRNAQWKFV